jgi:malate permease and related proteins
LFSEVFSIVAPVYLCAAVGFLWTRLDRPFDTRLMTDLIMNVGSPCLVFSSLVSYEIQLVEAAEMIGATVVATAGMAGVSALVLRTARMPLQTFLAPMTFGNTGNMGIPLCYFAFGETGLSLAICVFAATSMLHFTVGQAIWSGRVGWAEVVKTPLVWASGLAFLVMVTGFGLPSWLTRTASLLGSFTVPLMQLTLGISLARLGVVRLGRSFALAVLKMSVGIGVGLIVVGLFGLEGVAAGVLILACAMPAAVFNYMFAVRYDRSPADVASIVVVSTLLAAGAIPLLISVLLPESG